MCTWRWSGKEDQVTREEVCAACDLFAIRAARSADNGIEYGSGRGGCGTTPVPLHVSQLRRGTRARRASPLVIVGRARRFARWNSYNPSNPSSMRSRQSGQSCSVVGVAQRSALSVLPLFWIASSSSCFLKRRLLAARDFLALADLLWLK